MEISCLIALGSNTDGAAHLRAARRELRRLFPDITFAKACRTRPIGLRNPALFLNQTGCFRTPLSLKEVKQLLETVEHACAAVPKDKPNELIRIDIDLLRYGSETLKPEDMERPYIRRSLALLSCEGKNCK